MIEVFSVGERDYLKKKHMLANLSINRDTENLNINPVYIILLKNELLVSKGFKILQNHPGTRLPTRPRRIASMIANKRIISQQNIQLHFHVYTFLSSCFGVPIEPN